MFFTQICFLPYEFKQFYRSIAIMLATCECPNIYPVRFMLELSTQEHRTGVYCRVLAVA
jgi:hypothetical protein